MLEAFQISEKASLREAIRLIDRNKHGLIFATNFFGAVIGLATDGDIRRRLLEGVSLDDPVLLCVNSEFIWATQDTSREVILKRLDQRIKLIPILDADKKLVGVISNETFVTRAQESVFARARSPVRISFGGGGSDSTHYFSSDSGAVINATISLYSHATLRLREDKKISIHSRDLGESIHADSLEDVLCKSSRFGLIQSLLKTIAPDFGFDLYLHSDFPIGSGLGGSAAVSASILGCFNQFRLDKWTPHELAEITFQAERLQLGIAGGWQDQYATIFGGFNFIEFRMDQNIVHPLRINPSSLLELEESLILCDTGIAHHSGAIHEDQRIQMNNKSTRQLVKHSVDLTYRMRNHLLRGEFIEFGHALNVAWQYKRQFSNKITSEKLDVIYNNALKHGAIGGKLLGAGGGGFFIFYALPFRKYELMHMLGEAGLEVRPFRFENEGLRAATIREQKNLLTVKES